MTDEIREFIISSLHHESSCKGRLTHDEGDCDCILRTALIELEDDKIGLEALKESVGDLREERDRLVEALEMAADRLECSGISAEYQRLILGKR